MNQYEKYIDAYYYVSDVETQTKPLTFGKFRT